LDDPGARAVGRRQPGRARRSRERAGGIMKKPDSPLAIAAQEFEDELARYAQLGDAFVKASLATTKQLERANELIGEIAAQEERSAAAGGKLVAEVTAARTRQEELANLVVGKLPELKARNDVLGGLLAELGAIGADVGALNERAKTITPRELADGM